MSDYDDLGKIVLVFGIVATITAPIWAIPYCIWWIAKGKKEQAERDNIIAENEAKREQSLPLQNLKHIANSKPILYSSLKQKINSNQNIDKANRRLDKLKPLE